MKLNLGCGRKPLPGFVNLDVMPNGGTDVVWDLNTYPWPFRDGSVDFILASWVLDHLLSMDRVWAEINRVLVPGGRIEIRTVYSRTSDPFHLRRFDKRSIAHLTGGYIGRFRLLGKPRVRRDGGFPWWHAKNYLGVDLPTLPFTKGRELIFTLEKEDGL